MVDPITRLREAISARYAVEREVGAGGMATVYLAEDVKHKRKVAIKVLKPELSATIGAERFLREIQIITNLNHPYIVPVHDSGEADGLLYYVMPYVIGESLKERLDREKRIPPDEAIEILKEIAGAIDYAHRLGVVHRDIKPANILLSEGHALLADFGIAQAVSESGDERLTGTGFTPGSVHYMSPEQAAGGQGLDGRADIYSLGCLAFEILTGERLFSGTAQQVVVRHLSDRPPLLRSKVSSLPRVFETAISEALAKDPADRPDSARAFVEAMGGLRTPRLRTGRPALAAKLALGMKAAVFLLLGFGLWWSIFPRGTPAATLDPMRIAVLYFDDLSADGDLRYLSEGLTEALIQALGSVDPLTVVSRNGVKPYRNLDFPVDSLARLLGTGHLVEGSVEQLGDQLLARVRLIDGATGTEHSSHEVSGNGDDPVALRDRIVAETARFLGQELGREIQLVEARSKTENDEAWSLVREAVALSDDADILRWELGDTDAAERSLRRADSLLANAEISDPDWVEPSVRRGWVVSQLARLSASRAARSEPLLREGLAHAERALERWPESPSGLELRGSLLNDLSWLNSIAADVPASTELQRRAEADLRAAVSAEPGRVRAWVALGDLLRVQGNFSEASIAARRALDADPFLINAEKEILFSLAQVWLDLGDVERALAWNDQGRQHFPAEISFTAGKLVILAGWDDAPALPDTAWALAADLRGWPPSRLLAAGVLARAGLPDSARSVVGGVRAAGSEDPWLDYYEANTQIQLGDPTRAVELLGSYLEALPSRKSYIASDWWWRPLHDEPEFKLLVDATN